VENIP
jgi:citrate synthase